MGVQSQAGEGEVRQVREGHGGLWPPVGGAGTQSQPPTFTGLWAASWAQLWPGVGGRPAPPKAKWSGRNSGPARPFQGAIDPTTKLLGPLGVELRGGLPVSKNPACFISRLPHAIGNSSLTCTPRTEPEEAQEQA